MWPSHPWYHCVVGVGPTKRPQSCLESCLRLWRYQSSGSCITRTPFSPVTSWIEIAEGCTFHPYEDGIGPNTLPQSEPDSSPRSCRNLIPISVSACRPLKTAPKQVGHFMLLDATELFFIPLHSWRRAQPPPAIRSRISHPVVEECAIGFWDCKSPTLFSHVTSWIIHL